MKKLIILALGLTLTNCSSSNDREETPTEVQDFTNATFLKSTLVGTWKLTHTNYSGTWSSVTTLPGTAQYESNYSFKADDTYNYKPFTNPTNNTLNESGKFSVIPATKTYNAKLTLNYSYNGTPKTRTIILQNYKDGVVEIAENNISCPSGTCYERFKKQ